MIARVQSPAMVPQVISAPLASFLIERETKIALQNDSDRLAPLSISLQPELFYGREWRIELDASECGRCFKVNTRYISRIATKTTKTKTKSQDQTWISHQYDELVFLFFPIKRFFMFCEKLTSVH